MSLRSTALAAIVLSTALTGLATADAPVAGAQMAGSPPTAPSGPVNPVKALDNAVTALDKLWTGAANAMPADKYSFAPSAAIFAPTQAVKYEGVRTFAQIVTHTIQANYRYFSLMSGLKPDADVTAIGKLTDKADILKAVATVTVANSWDAVPGRPGQVNARLTLFAGAIAHAEDEYGQAVEYLRMNAIIPPASAPREP
jgi:hypothetical protein